MSGLVDKTDQGLAGTDAVLRQIANVQPQGPLAYTTYDFLKHFAGAISICKFIAHVFSLPVMVFLRRDFGMRYVDDIHIALSFFLWQVIGLLSLGASDNILGNMISPVLSIFAWIFLPVALFHRHRAKMAALKGEGYSYYPGNPMLTTLTLKVVGAVFRRLDRLLGKRLPYALTHPEQAINPDAIQGLVRRFVEPPVVFMLGVICAGIINVGFGLFLTWTAMFLFVNETLSQREMWELYLDQVDSQVIAEERQRMRSGDAVNTASASHGFSLASLANPRDLLKAARQTSPASL